jgi:hypothetical protein
MVTPKKKTVQELDLKSLARGYTKRALQTLGGIVENGESEAARVTASIALLDRGWGKPNQPHDAKLDGELRITIRKMLGSKDEDE